LLRILLGYPIHMRKARLLVALGATSFVCTAASAPAVEVGERYSEGERASSASAVPGEIVVGFEAGTSGGERAETRREAGVRAVRALGMATQLVEVTQGSTADALADLRGDGDVLHASRNWLRRPSALPDDPLFGQLWGLHNTGQPIGQKNPISGLPDADIDAPEAWDIELGWNPDPGSPEPVVAVMDTGVDLGHRDLASRLWTNPGEVAGNDVDDDGNGYVDDVHGYDFAGEDLDDPLDRDANPDDPDGHGTHVAGTILAEGDDGEGIVGVAPGSRLMALKVCALDGEGEASCPLAAMIEAYAYATGNGARVLNGSLGGSGFAPAEVALLNANPETLFVFAAGNESADNDAEPSYPCGLDELPGYSAGNLLCVAATTPSDGLASFSNHGAESVDLGAPGVRTLSAYPEDLVDTSEFLPYVYLSGTSMAAPHVSGAAALMLAAAPATAPPELKAAILGSGDAVPALAGKTVSGRRLNLRGALEALVPVPPPGPEGEGEGEDGEDGTAQPSLPLAPNPIAQQRTQILARPGPRAFFRKRPGRIVRTRQPRVRLSFRFGSDQSDVVFRCGVDDRRLRRCGRRFSFEFTVGEHVVRVRARDEAGSLGPLSTHRFRVIRVEG
jgi:subtilisin family serine protease